MKVMTVKTTQLELAKDSSRGWIYDLVTTRKGTDVLAQISPFVQRTIVLPAVRGIMRDRSDCRMIPVVDGLVKLHKRDDYGSDWIIEVRYTPNWSATYGFTYDRPQDVQCYMD